MPIINNTYTIQLPNGAHEDVNIFDYNLNYICDRYVQCENGAFIKARACEIIQSNREV